MKKSALLIIISATFMFFTRCGSSPPVQKYILTPTIEKNAESHSGNYDAGIAVGIGRIEFSEYLMRPELVSFKGNNELNVDEFNRWGEPLKKNFERVLLENLSRLIPTNRIFIFPAQKIETNSFLISIVVNEFGIRSDSAVVLDTRWNVSRKSERDFLMTQHSFYSENAAGLTIEQRVGLLSNLVGKLSRDIANEIKKDK